MNIETAYIKSEQTGKIIEILETRINSVPDPAGMQPKGGLPDSYDTCIATNAKRKIALSQPCKGWSMILESNETNDYRLLVKLSRELHTEVLAVILYDATGAWGYEEINSGVTGKVYFSEKDDDMEGLIERLLRKKKISIPIQSFRDIAHEKFEGWNLILRKQG